MKSTKQIFESLGSLTRGKYERGEFSTIGSSSRLPDYALKTSQSKINNIIRSQGKELHGVKLFDFNFRAWQSTLIQTLKNGNNVYQVASPGAGKTAPVVFHWATVLGLNPNMDLDMFNVKEGPNRFDVHAANQVNLLINNLLNFLDYPKGSLNNIPKILYVCPVRQLVYEVQKDFNNYISQLIYHLIHIAITVSNTKELTSRRNNIMGPYINDSRISINIGQLINILRQNGIDVSRQVANKQKLYNEMQHFISIQINDSRAQKLANDIQILDEQILKIITDRLKIFITNNIVCIKTKEDSIKNHNAPIIITIYQSVKNVFKKMDESNLRLFIIDEAHLVQQIDHKDNNAKDVSSALYYVLRNMKSSTQLILLSGTVNPGSASNLINYLKNAMNIDIKQLTSGNEGRNPSNISVMPMDSLNNDNTLIQLMLNPSENNNVIILFSKKRIDSLVDEALKRTQGHQYTADQIQRGKLQTRKSQSMNIDLNQLEKDRPENIKKGFNLDRKKFLDLMNKMPEVNEISNEKLLKCVMSGFGYIYRVKDDASANEKRNAGKDAQIVAHLFSKGKIRTLLATNAVGIGINLTIKNMYVPQVKKWDGSEMTSLPISDASQLYNRTGRMAFTVSSIYTPQQNVDEIIQAISASNNKFDMRETLGRFKQMTSRSSGEKYFNIVWGNFSRYISSNLNP